MQHDHVPAFHRTARVLWFTRAAGSPLSQSGFEHEQPQRAHPCVAAGGVWFDIGCNISCSHLPLQPTEPSTRQCSLHHVSPLEAEAAWGARAWQLEMFRRRKQERTMLMVNARGAPPPAGHVEPEVSTLPPPASVHAAHMLSPTRDWAGSPASSPVAAAQPPSPPQVRRSHTPLSPRQLCSSSLCPHLSRSAHDRRPVATTTRCGRRSARATACHTWTTFSSTRRPSNSPHKPSTCAPHPPHPPHPVLCMRAVDSTRLILPPAAPPPAAPVFTRGLGVRGHGLSQRPLDGGELQHLRLRTRLPHPLRHHRGHGDGRCGPLHARALPGGA
jgi:hypothetical protein